METRGTSLIFGSTRIHLCMPSPLLLSLITGSFPPLFLESSMYTAWTDTLIVYTSGQHATHHLYTSTYQLYMVSILVNAISHVNLPVSFSLRHLYPPCLPTQSPSASDTCILHACQHSLLHQEFTYNMYIVYGQDSTPHLPRLFTSLFYLAMFFLLSHCLFRLGN